MARIRGATSFYTADIETNTVQGYKGGTGEKADKIV